MGLDMSIYRILPPAGIKAGDRISRDDWTKMRGTDLLRTDSNALCDTIRRIGVICSFEEQHYERELAVLDMFRRLTADKETAERYAACYRYKGGMSAMPGQIAFAMQTDNAEPADFLRSIGVQENAPHKECISVDLESTPTYQLVCVIWKPMYIHVEYRTPGDKERYRGRYIRSEWRDYYFYRTKELAYQREGLKPNGWRLLPEGFCDNKALIAHLVRRCGLSHDFIKNWEEGCTVFNAWW